MRLRPTTIDDIDFIIVQETRDDFKYFIGHWSRDEHSRNLSLLDKCYSQIENDDGETIGYAILSGVTSPNRSIELTRIVIAKPNQGHGKKALRLILKKVFAEYNAHRFSLDVFEHNLRAISVYQSLGFKKEGVLREAVKQDHKYSSLVIMSILENEYFQDNV